MSASLRTSTKMCHFSSTDHHLRGPNTLPLLPRTLFRSRSVLFCVWCCYVMVMCLMVMCVVCTYTLHIHEHTHNNNTHICIKPVRQTIADISLNYCPRGRWSDADDYRTFGCKGLYPHRLRLRSMESTCILCADSIEH